MKGKLMNKYNLKITRGRRSRTIHFEAETNYFAEKQAEKEIRRKRRMSKGKPMVGVLVREEFVAEYHF